MNRPIILSAFLIAFSIIFTGTLFTYHLDSGGSDFLSLILVISGVGGFIVFVLMCKELLPSELFANSTELYESEKKLLEDNDISTL